MKRLKVPDPPRLHIGCGGNKLPGWLNVDLDPRSNPDLRLDVTQGFPFSDDTVELIHSEDFVEHLTLPQGKAFFQECHRVLKPDGVMRVLTPDLRQVLRQYANREEGSLAFYRESFGCITFAEVVNMAMRMGGHHFLYDRETLDMVLEECGFMVRHVSFGESPVSALRAIDIRGTGMPLYTECEKRPPQHRFARTWQGVELAETWHPANHLRVALSNALLLEADGRDPQLVSHAFFFPAVHAHRVCCEMRVPYSEGEIVQLFWKSDSNLVFCEENSLTLPLVRGGSVSTYTFDLGSRLQEGPNNVIRQLRLDPMNGRGEAEIRRIVLD